MRLALSLLVLVTACSETPEKPTADRVTAQSPARPRPSAAATADPAPAMAIAGEYRVAGIDGQDINQPHGITASISADRIHVTADCLNFGWSYTLQGSSIITKRVPVEGCARGLTAAEEALVAAFDRASIVARTPANALELRAPGHTATLFSQ